MDYQKYTIVLGKIHDEVPRFVTKKGIELHNQPGEKNNNFNKQLGFKTSMLRSDLCDYSDAYIVVKGIITVEGRNKIERENNSLALKNIAPFTSCFSKINNTLIDNAEDLDIVMPMYNLL